MVISDIFELYDQFYRQVSLNPLFESNRKPSDVKIVEGFLRRIEKDYKSQLDLSWLIFYFEKQFAYYADTVTPFGKGIPLIGWVVGNKAYQRFRANSLVEKSFTFKRKVQLKTDLLEITSHKDLAVKKTSRLFLELNSFEEYEKKVFLNQDEGLIWCYNHTTMYNHKSSVCVGCSFKEKCKSLLHTKLPNIYMARGYE